VTVLSVFRGSLIMPNPGGDYEILPGDRLLCYGKLMTIRSLIPTRQKQPRRRRRTQAENGTDTERTDAHGNMPERPERRDGQARGPA